MCIKSDKWIRMMAEQHRMIEPFTASLVREAQSFDDLHALRTHDEQTLNILDILGRYVERDEYNEFLQARLTQEEILAERNSRVISYGLSSFGYDLRVADEYDILVPNYQDGPIVDPKSFDKSLLHRVEGQGYCIIPPNSFALATSVEYLRIPRNAFCICVGKSTYARVGLVVNVTPFEPAWEGQVTLELSNTTPLPMKVYSNEGICQVLFFESDEECEVSYADRNGKYQGQRGITSAKV